MNLPPKRKVSRQMLEITLRRSYIGVPEKHRKILRALGLRKIGMIVKKKDDPSINGMIKKVRHMVEVSKSD